jgi:co-chaperonin GroES (HSP10)
MTPEDIGEKHERDERRARRLAVDPEGSFNDEGKFVPPKGKGFYLEPLPSTLIVIEDGFKYEGLIAIPHQAQRRSTTGKVVAIGEGVTKVQVGDHVVWPQLSGTLIKFRGHPDYHIFNEDEILAKIIGNAELEGMAV